MDHHFLVTNVDTMRHFKEKSSFNWRTGMVSVIVTALIVCASCLDIAGIGNKSSDKPVEFLGSTASESYQTPSTAIVSVSGSANQESEQNSTSITQLRGKKSNNRHPVKKTGKAHKPKVLHIKGYEIRGPFPKIGMYGVVPQTNADIVDSMQDPQVNANLSLYFACRC
jgi:hypothetical protein